MVFNLHGHYFVGHHAFKKEVNVPLVRYTELPPNLLPPSKSSYDKTSLAKMQRTLRALKQMNVGNARLKNEILIRGLDPDSTDLTVQTHTASLRQQIFNKQVKQPATKRKETALLKRIEALKLKLHLLRQEKEAVLNEIDEKNKRVESEVAETEKAIDTMTTKFHGLSKDKEKLGEWMKTFDEFRGYKEKAGSDLVTRRKQLISQLTEIFPINDANSSLPTIGMQNIFLKRTFWFLILPQILL